MRFFQRVLMAGFGAALLAVTVAWAGPGPRLRDAPKFVAGPRITGAGLIWLSSTGQMLTGSTGVNRRLSSGPPLPLSSPDSKWEAQESRRGVGVGEIGVGLSRIAPLRRCPPLRATGSGQRILTETRPMLLAVSGERLFAIVDPTCLHRHGYGHAAILVEDLGARVWKLLASVPTGALSLAAAGERLAIAHVSKASASTAEEGELTVGVYNSRTGRRIFRVASALTARQLTPPRTAVDDLGDVLVMETTHRPIPAPRGSSGWWASPGRPVAHRLLHELSPSGAAAISHGRIAYATGGGYSGETIKLLNLRTGRARTAVHLQGEAGLLGLDLSPDDLAWAWQNTVPVGTRQLVGGGVLITCSIVPVGDAKLMSIRIRSLPVPGITIGKPLPAVDQPPCTRFERAIP
jgi:hypothetical protein